MTIPALPALSRTSPTFRADLDSYFLTNLPATTGAINAALAGIEADIAQSETARDEALLSANAADVSRLAAQAAASKALADGNAAVAAAQVANTSFKGAWSALTGALALPATVMHDRKYWVLLVPLADVAAATPGASESWAPVSSGASAAKIFFLTH